MGNKRFKDPIYGYVEVDDNIVQQVLDTAAFQRLRNIIQTSYSPLYSSALHNRFAHSIGVYHLGKLAVNAFQKSCVDVPSTEFPELDKYFSAFLLACLLHDVGHAPFSHTGEALYLKNAKYDSLHREIAALTDDAMLEEEIRKNSYKTAPHELMSVVVSLKIFGKVIPAEMRSFFARCITGYKYTEEMDAQKELMNCLIELLNSKVIDVDKLDYLIRDSYMTGFDTVKIDYVRLLESIRVVHTESGYEICYYKSAVSVIENVVYAHDAERKWIQNHPSVLYEAYLIENIFHEIIHEFMESDYLDYVYLTEEGQAVKNMGTVRLMGDADILFLMKNLPQNLWVSEYFERRKRKHPIWKTEAEFQAIFRENEQAAEIIETEFEDLSKVLKKLGYPFVINEQALAVCESDAQQLQDLMQKEEDALQKEMVKETFRKRKHQIKFVKILQSFAKEESIDFDFNIILAKQFNSGFGKQEFSKIKMMFPELSVPCKFGEVSNALTSMESKGEKFFYLFYKRKSEKQVLGIATLVEELLTLAYAIQAEDKIKEKKQHIR